MTYAVSLFVEEKLGNKYITARTVEFEKSYEETSSSTPTFFILSPGVNPLKDVEKMGKKLGFIFDKGNFHSVSLGQGQEIVAENAMDVAAEQGHWVILQNIHLVQKWLATLEKKMEQCSESGHENYRYVDVLLRIPHFSTSSGYELQKTNLEHLVCSPDDYSLQRVKTNVHRHLSSRSAPTAP
nr:unnamed protein product [Callosobruchus analis]